MVQRLLNHLSENVYLAFFPSDFGISGAQTYLWELKSRVPMKAFLIQVVLALFVYLAPVLYLELPLPLLAVKRKELILRKLMNSRIYLFRLIAFAVKSHALMAVFREPDARAEFELDYAWQQ